MAPVKKTPPSKRLARKSATSGPSKLAQKKNNAGGKLPSKMTKQVKTKPGAQTVKSKKKKPSYTDAQLNLPVLNSIVPANAKTTHKAGGTGKKKGKVYVDDAESMMTIMAIVNAEKDGELEGKVQKERQMEEIREARRKEAEKKELARRGKIESVKEDIKSAKRSKRFGSGGQRERDGAGATGKTGQDGESGKEKSGKPKRKSVSFA